MSKIEKFKNEIHNSAVRYTEASKVCEQAEQIADVLERRMTSILDISRSILPLDPSISSPVDASVSSMSLLQEFTDRCLQAKEATPKKAELIDLDAHPHYPSFPHEILSDARCMETLVNDIPRDNAEAAQLIESAFQSLASAITELGQARDLLIHSHATMHSARMAGENIVGHLELYNHTF